MIAFPLAIEQFLAPQSIETVMRWIDRSQHKFGTLTSPTVASFWDGRVIQGEAIDGEALMVMQQNRAKISRLIRVVTEDDRTLYSDTLQIVRWPVGYEQRPHADACNPDGSVHPYPYREFASITYLNDNFDGGDLYLPEWRRVIRPRPGLMVVLPGTLKYLHGVRPVTRGVRYTLASFFTHDASRGGLL